MTYCKHIGRLAAIAATIAAVPPALAQAPMGRSGMKLAGGDPVALKRLEPIQTRLNSQILQAFKGNEPLKAQMEADLKAIGETDDPARKRAMIATYQKKFGPQYKSVLAAGKVDLNAAAREMTAAVPGMRFTLRDGLSLKAVATPADATRTVSTQSNGSRPPTLATTEVLTLNGPDYTFRKERGCSNIAGGDVVRSGGYMRAEAFSIVGGGCTADGEMTYEFTVAKNQDVEVALTFNLSAETFAVGVVGSTFANASNGVHVVSLDSHGQPDDSVQGLSESNYCGSFAGILMADSDECGIDGVRKSAIITRAGRYRLTAYTRGSTMAIAAGGTAQAALHQLRATLTFRPH